MLSVTRMGRVDQCLNYHCEKVKISILELARVSRRIGIEAPFIFVQKCAVTVILPMFGKTILELFYRVF